jgi:hypothetical protein
MVLLSIGLSHCHGTYRGVVHGSRRRGGLAVWAIICKPNPYHEQAEQTASRTGQSLGKVSKFEGRGAHFCHVNTGSTQNPASAGEVQTRPQARTTPPFLGDLDPHSDCLPGTTTTPKNWLPPLPRRRRRRQRHPPHPPHPNHGRRSHPLPAPQPLLLAPPSPPPQPRHLPRQARSHPHDLAQSQRSPAPRREAHHAGQAQQRDGATKSPRHPLRLLSPFSLSPQPQPH